MGKTFREWLAEGEQLYAQAMNEFRAIEQQLEALDQQLAAKKSEVNEIARVVGKPPVESSRRLTAQLVESSAVGPAHPAQPAGPPGSVARALTGRVVSR